MVAPGPPPPDVALPPVAAFAARLRALRRDSGGPSIRELEIALRAAGKPFSRSTISDKLAGASRPSWEFVEAFVRACAAYGRDAGRPEPLDEWRPRFRELLVALARGDDRFPTDQPGLPQAAVPRELPPVAAGFTGRSAELDAVVGLLAAGLPATGLSITRRDALPVAVISGTAGVGKTALAILAAHRVVDAYPDGQIYLDLRGYHPLEPLAPIRALASLCRSLGVTDAESADDPDAGAARWRSLAAGRRVLIVLDNASGDAQVTALLPGDAGCGVIVTSRDTLAGTVVRHGATRVDLAPLPDAEARRLLTDLIGARAVDRPAMVGTLAALCARLPLALRIVAEVAVANPEVPLAAFCADLADESRRLDFFDAGADPLTGIRPVLSWSVRLLTDPAARAFRLLGAYPGTVVEAASVAALCGCDQATAARLLDELRRAHLVQPAGTGGFSCHDLLRAYTRELGSQGPDGEREAAVVRLLRAVAASAAAAMDLAYPAERHRRPRVDPAGLPVPVFGDAAGARDWLDAHTPLAVALVGSAELTPVGAEVLRLAAVFWRHLDVRAAHREAATMHAAALAVARRLGDRAAEALGLHLLGLATMRLGRLDDATEHFLAAHEIRAELGDALGLAAVRNALGLTLEQRGKFDDAAIHLRAAIATARDAGEALGTAAGLGNLARVLWSRGRLDEAIGCLTEAIGVYRVAGDAPGEAQMRNNLGFVRFLRGEDDAAEADFAAARAVCAEIGDRRGLAWAHHNSANVRRRRGEFAEALDQFDVAAALFEEIGDALGVAGTRDSIGEAWQTQHEYAIAYGYHDQARATAQASGAVRLHASALNGMGEDATALGRLDEASACHQRAEQLAIDTNDTYQQARAMWGLAYVSREGARQSEALRLSHGAHALFASMGAIEATYLEIEIAALEGAGPDH